MARARRAAKRAARSDEAGGCVEVDDFESAIGGGVGALSCDVLAEGGEVDVVSCCSDVSFEVGVILRFFVGEAIVSKIEFLGF